jgi:hypothetical protein
MFISIKLVVFELYLSGGIPVIAINKRRVFHI